MAGMAASNPTESSLDFDGESHPAAAEAVSLNYADVLGFRPFLGRWFASEDEPAAVLSYAAWRRLFNGDPNVLGKRVRSETQWYTVVGVAPKEFTGIYMPMSIDLWVPFQKWAQQHQSMLARMEDRERPQVFAFGRLKNGIAAGQATADLNAIATQIAKEDARSAKAPAPIIVEHVRGVPNINPRRAGTPIAALLMVVVGLVLLIACVNVGNLLLARGASRRREISVKIALGAGRSRLLRQLITESLVLACFGGLAGTMLGGWTSRLLETTLLGSAYGESIQIVLSSDVRVMIFTALLAFFTTLLFGLAPAWRVSRTDVMSALKGDVPAGGRLRLRHLSLVGQVSISLVLLLTAGLFLRVLLRFQDSDPGFTIANRLFATIYVSPPEFTVETGRQFYTEALDRIGALPGVKHAALVDWLPLQPINPGCASQLGGEPFPTTSNSIDAGFLTTMRIPLVAGRNFAASDRPDGPPVAIVNESLAHRLWPHEAAIGKRVLLGCRGPALLEVIGVARDSKFRSLGEVPLPHVYRAFSQTYSGGLQTLLLETASDPGSLAESVRKAVMATNPAVRLYGIRTLREHLRQSYWGLRFEASALAIFGGLALLLAAVGLYGVLAYHVALRTREFGIRMAIGARRQDVFRLVFRQGLQLTMIGVALGIAFSLMLARVLANLLYGVSPTDFTTYALTALLWLVVAVAACYFPARRATRVQPLVALRHE
jgi:predicted permease